VYISKLQTKLRHNFVSYELKQNQVKYGT